MSAYATALRGAVTPGCTVIDLGAEPGVFAILACRYGAGKVIAIEPDASIGLLPQLACDNGCVDRIEIFQGVSTDYEPTMRADVIVSDLRGGLLLFEGHIDAIRDARELLLAPGGILIPERDHLRIGAVESSDAYDRFDQPWRSNAYDIDLSAGSRFAVNSQTRLDLTDQVLLGRAQHLATLDYMHIVDPNLRSKVTLPIDRAGVVHGLLLWFDTELAPSVTYSNAPGQPPLVYYQTFFPLEQPVKVDAGDTLHAEIKANMLDGSYTWSWNTALTSGPNRVAKPCFRQSTFLANIFQSRQLVTRSEQFVPNKTEAATTDAVCLSLIDGKRDLNAIAGAVAEQFPTAFACFDDALKRATEIVGRYCGQN